MQKNKISLATLIANDIVRLGMNRTSSFNYIIDLDDYAKEFNRDSEDYIMNHKDEILNEINSNKNVAQIDYNSKTKKIDIVFYLDSLMDRLEKLIYETAKIIKNDLEIDEVWYLSDERYFDEEFRNMIITKGAKSSLGGDL